MSDAAEHWISPHPRSALAGTLVVAAALLAALVPVCLGIVRSDGSLLAVSIIAGAFLVIVLGAYVAEVLRTRHTQLALDGQWVRYRFEFVFRKHISLPRERIRTVELSADPAQRMLGIATLRLGTGEKNGQIVMRSLGRADAERLRNQLLDRRQLAEGDVYAGTSARADAVELARWQPSWLRYAPVSVATPILAGAAFGISMQIAEWFGAAPQVWQQLSTPVRTFGVIIGIATMAVIAAILGAVAAVVFHAEAWWNYRLERQPDGTLRIERGLIFHRSTVFEGSRIRGAVLVERLGSRLLGGARIDLIAMGLRSAEENQKAESSTVVPDVPREYAAAIFEILTGEQLPTHLQAHPLAAKHKRLRWAVAASLCVSVLAAILALTTEVGWWLIALSVLVSGPAAIFLARASYAALGHSFTTSHVYLRFGAIKRATHALRRDAIVSWNVRQSTFQRRTGLASTGATTAADQAIIFAPDVGMDQASAILGESDRRIWEPLLRS